MVGAVATAVAVVVAEATAFHYIFRILSGLRAYCTIESIAHVISNDSPWNRNKTSSK